MLSKAFLPLIRPPSKAFIFHQTSSIVPLIASTANALKCPAAPSFSVNYSTALRPVILTTAARNTRPLYRTAANSGWHSSHSRTSYRHILFASATAIATLVPSDEENERTTTHILVPVSGTETREAGLYLASQLDQERTSRGLNRPNPSKIYLWYKRVVQWFYRFCYNPVTTCLRFVQLVALFGPVIITLPAVLVGPSVVSGINRADRIASDAANAPTAKDRLGAIWWYKYLTWTMEMAGPPFIKVRRI